MYLLVGPIIDTDKRRIDTSYNLDVEENQVIDRSTGTEVDYEITNPNPNIEAYWYVNPTTKNQWYA